MKAMKKAVSIVLTLCLVLSMLAVAAVSVSAEGEDVYVITGSSDWLDGWRPAVDGDYVMTKQGDGTYAVTVANVQPGTANYQCKVVKYARDDEAAPDWIGDNGTNDNYVFMVKQACDVTVTFNPANNEINATGEGVADPEYTINKITAVGAGMNGFLNNVSSWDPDDESNKMDEVAPGVYEITYTEVEPDYYEFKFAANGGWGMNWGVPEGTEVNINTPCAASYNSGNICFYLYSDVDYVSVTLKLDLTNWNSSTKTGATFTILVDDGEEPSSEEPSSAEPTTAEPTTVEPTTVEPSDAYYLVKNTDEWEISNDRKFTINPANQSEYVLNNVALDNGEEFKVVRSLDGENVKSWYPDGMDNNYIVNASGNYDVYFRPDGRGGDDWHYHTIFATECSLQAESLSIGGGDIAMNFYFRLTNDQVGNSPEVIFNWAGVGGFGREEKATITKDNSEVDVDTGVRYYRATCHVPAAEMEADISVSYNLDPSDQYNYWNAAQRVYTVADAAIEYATGDYGEKVNALAKAMLDYGKAAQAQFDTDNPSGYDGVEILSADQIATYEGGSVNIPDCYTQPDLSEYGVKYVGCTLMLQSKTTLRFYFKKTTDVPTAEGTYYDSGALTPLEGQDNFLYLERTNIGVCDLDEESELVIGSTELGSYSALSYVKAALASENTDNKLKRTVSALYNYYKAAKDWKQSQSLIA